MSESPPQAELDVLEGFFDSRRLADVVDHGEALLARFPDSFILCHMIGTASGMLGRDEQAADYFGRALQAKPDLAIGHVNHGVALQKLDRKEEAVASFQRALQLQPDSVEAHHCLASTLHALDRLDEAATAYETALRIRPDTVEACYNLGVVLEAAGRLEEAVARFRQAVQLQPNFSEAYHNLGTALQGLRRSGEAIACFQRALEITPDFAEAHLGLGIELQHLRRRDEAIASFRRALEIKPEYTEAYLQLGALLQTLGRIDEAIDCYERVLRFKPDHAEARAQKLYQQAQICDWDALQSDRHLIPHLGVSGDAVSPFTLLAFDDDPARNRTRSEAYAAQEYKRWSPPLSLPSGVDVDRARPDRLRIGYFSAEFHEHATMHLIARLFELHDRRRFAVHLFSYGPENADAMRQRVQRAVETFHDVRTLTDKEIAERARHERIDIAVDLKGYTQANRLGIFAHRAAPIQISYLGYPGTLGAPFFDYIVADPVVIPDEERQHISEKIIFLPNSYQVNDDSRRVSDRPITRADVGLPEQGFVFCCFNNSFKISPQEFDIWMRLLERVDGSVLWLLRSNKWVEGNLRREAQRRGIDADRLIFADRMALPDHLARHRLADLFLDSFNYNAHTTSSDALWAGVPVVTKAGQGFAARVAASLLSGVGLPELITTTSEDHERLALELARHPETLSQIRAKLAANRLTAPLFDSALFTRHIEAAYTRVHRDHVEGRPAADIMVEPDPLP